MKQERAEAAEQKAYRYQLQSCVWELTLACCFSCAYCGSKAGRAREGELSTRECLNVARRLADMGCRRVTLIGGEVFMRDDWSVIAKALTDWGVKTAIITNGFLFTDAQIARLKAANVESVAVSLDGPEQIHDAFRQKGSFQRAMTAIDRLAGNGIHVSVISTLHSGNVPYLEEMYEILREKPIFAWQLQACSPMGNAAGGVVSTAIDFAAVIAFVEEHVESAPFVMGIADNIGYYTPSEERLRGEDGAVFLGCCAGLTGIGIDSVGNVRGCESMYDDAFIEGNLREKPLSEIWNDPEAFAYNRRFTGDLLSGGCAGCSRADWCAGGCRSYNYFATGRLYECPCCAGRFLHGAELP